MADRAWPIFRLCDYARRNWSRFSDATANVISPLLAYEGLTAFFLAAPTSSGGLNERLFPR